MDLRIYQYIAVGDFAEDEVPQGFWFREELERMCHHTEEINHGLITCECYYADQEESELVVKACYDYTRNAVGVITHQNAQVFHYDEDGNQNDEPFTYSREFTPRQQMKLITKRRLTVVSTVKGKVLEYLFTSGAVATPEEAMQVGGMFIVQHTDTLTAYEVTGSPAFVETVKLLPDPWLDAVANPDTGQTIRQYIVAEME